MSEDDDLRKRVRREGGEVPRSGLARLWKTGRAAAKMGASVLGGSFRGRGEGLDAAKLEDVEKLVVSLGELKGIAMKAGQILGYVDPTLRDELRERLAILQTQSSATPFAVVRSTVEAAFGERADTLLAEMNPEPLAIASIGQVHRARVDGVEVAVKVRHPGIRDAVEADFGAASVGIVFAKMFAPGGGGESVKGFVDEARRAILEETDFALEGERQSRFRAWLTDDPDLVVPEVLDAWRHESVLVTRWTPGLSLDAWLASNPSPALRDRVGVALFRFYVGTLYARGSFHADPHPGNYAFLPDGRVVLYDFGCVRDFEPGVRHAFALVARSLRRGDDDAAARALASLGVPSETAEERARAARLLRAFFAPLLEHGVRAMASDEAMEAKSILASKRELLKLRLPGQLLFLLRIRFGLYAILARLGARADWGALEAGWAEASGTLDA
ncbi:MAG: hypothetical protein H6721_07145 [Sandaracinus sp.]|nr:hypothetical protein [Myxococcales bacterium]MCB9603216.1 hypothetical protein [Sandaracinus sp.]MCB9612656.1 hypothetical protein [Sandaracinus sp.]MCB9619986.1 hypothetical protein [Sandaracinus sp.]MCB9623018.1 hypothetical protein [Sandaracinus sp.]